MCFQWRRPLGKDWTGGRLVQLTGITSENLEDILSTLTKQRKGRRSGLALEVFRSLYGQNQLRHKVLGTCDGSFHICGELVRNVFPSLIASVTITKSTRVSLIESCGTGSWGLTVRVDGICFQSGVSVCLTDRFLFTYEVLDTPWTGVVLGSTV